MELGLSIFTFTMGREKYLETCIQSVIEDIKNTNIKLEHHIICQGIILSNKLKQIIKANSHCILHEWPKNIGIGEGINKIIPALQGNLLFKMDEDCCIVSKDFFKQALSIYEKLPNIVFSPFPTGLINSRGGVGGTNHYLWWNKNIDFIYCLRKVHHVGGFARFTPAKIMKNFIFPSDLIYGISGTEDGKFSEYCNNNNISMFYIEDGLVVSHIESSLGQVLRYPEHFKNRQWEGSVKLNIIE